MRPAPNPLVERHRITRTAAASAGPYAARFGSTSEDGNNGMFMIPNGTRYGRKIGYFVCIISDGGGWEHCSVSLHIGPPDTHRPGSTTAMIQTPDWEQMCAVKALFWGDEERVVQYHPPMSEYVNVHPSVLHLWRPVDGAMPSPPIHFV